MKFEFVEGPEIEVNFEDYGIKPSVDERRRIASLLGEASAIMLKIKVREEKEEKK